MMSSNLNVFADPNKRLPFNTKVVACIRTENDEPVYSKMYPFPMGAADFVNKEIKDLLRNGIIRPSNSPYNNFYALSTRHLSLNTNNNPIWVVGKKGTDASGSPNKRLVVDFRKLNSKTIADKYPMPSISMILSNLGKASYFTTLDLKSGYHQINLAEGDREKTSFSVKSGKYEFCRMFIMFGSKTRHLINFTSREDLLDLVKNVVTPNVVNVLHCELPVLAHIQHKLVKLFPATKLWYA
ncbi:hypothetical protein KR032_002658, partial [Drosophila birchii]